MILEAGYTASGLDTYGQTILPALARTTRVCTYDRAGDGISDPRPTWVKPLTGATQARELHRLLASIHVGGPYVVVGHSYGGMISREFGALYPAEVVGMVLIDASSEPEIPVYDRLHAGPWIDGTVTPAPNQRIDIHATVRQLKQARSLGPLPLVVITAGILQDKWLRTVPMLEARAQTRLADLSTNSIHVVDRGIGHSIPANDPTIVLTAARAIVRAARSHTKLRACQQVFAAVRSALCLARNRDISPAHIGTLDSLLAADACFPRTRCTQAHARIATRADAPSEDGAAAGPLLAARTCSLRRGQRASSCSPRPSARADHPLGCRRPIGSPVSCSSSARADVRGQTYK